MPQPAPARKADHVEKRDPRELTTNARNTELANDARLEKRTFLLPLKWVKSLARQVMPTWDGNGLVPRARARCKWKVFVAIHVRLRVVITLTNRIVDAMGRAIEIGFLVN